MLKFILISQLIILPIFRPVHVSKINGKLKGIVLMAGSNKPIKDVYLYIIKGEEEATTNSRGEFEITTWQKAPFFLTVKHAQFKDAVIKIKSLEERVTVFLQPK